MAYNSKRTGGEVEHLLDYTSQLETSLPEKFSEIDKRIAQTEESTESIQTKLPALENAKATTYEKLVNMCHSGLLVRGTDYKFAFKTIYRSGGVNKESDTEYTIIAHAIAKNKISSDVKIYEHPEWEVKYTMEDGDTRLEWSREDDMGQIYYLKDERGNSAGFDFKNIEMPMYKHLTSLGEVIWLGTTESICDSVYVDEIGWFKLFSDDTKLYNITIEHEFGKLPNSHVEYTGTRADSHNIYLKNSYLHGSSLLTDRIIINSCVGFSGACDVKTIKDSIISLSNVNGGNIKSCCGNWSSVTFTELANYTCNFSDCKFGEIYNDDRNMTPLVAHSQNATTNNGGTWKFKGSTTISNTAGKTYSTGKYKTIKFSRNVLFTFDNGYADDPRHTKLNIFGYANSATDDAYISILDNKELPSTRYVFPKGDAPQLVAFSIDIAPQKQHTIQFRGAQVCAIISVCGIPKYKNIHGNIYLPKNDFGTYYSTIYANTKKLYPQALFDTVTRNHIGYGFFNITDEGACFYSDSVTQNWKVQDLEIQNDSYHLVYEIPDDFKINIDYSKFWDYLHPCMKEFYSETIGVITHRLVDPYTLIEVCDEKQLSKYDNDAGFITEQDYFSEVEVTDTEAVQTIRPNVFYKFGLRDNLEIIFDSTSEKDGIIKEYRFEFTTTTDSVITLPSSILWEEEPVFENGTTYQISVFNNVGAVTSVIPPPMNERYMYLQPSSNNFTFTFTGHIYYLIEGTTTWTYLAPNTSSSVVPSGKKAYLKGRLEDNYSYSNYGIGQFNGSNSYSVGGNLKSLVLFDSAYKANFTPPDRCFFGLFASNKYIHSAYMLDLTMTSLSYQCFSYMFADSSLVFAPDLPNVPLGRSCCGYMFESCENLEYAPELPSTTLAEGCYDSMFYESALKYEEHVTLPAEYVPKYAYRDMFGETRTFDITLLCKTYEEGAFGDDATWLYYYGSGTIYIHPDTNWTHEDLNIPERWTIEKAVLDETNNE